MKAFLAFTGELHSNRFELLCEHLDCLDDRDARYRVFAHLNIWYARWAGDTELDSGIFWDVAEKRLGHWAEWPNPLAFGRGLVHAGYVAKLEDVYPPEILKERKGYVARSPEGGVMLDLSWDSTHRKPPRCAQLCLFLTDRLRRLKVAREIGLNLTGVPADWVPTSTGVPVSSDGSRKEDAGAGPPAGNIPAIIRPTSGLVAAVTPPAPPLDVSEDVQKNNGKNEIQRRDVRNGSPVNNSNQPAGGTGRTKSIAMRDFIRANKYERPLECLLYMDDTPDARKLWIEAINRDVGYVQTVLADMVETDESWTKIGKPAAVATSQILRHVRRCRQRDADDRNVQRRQEGGRVG